MRHPLDETTSPVCTTGYGIQRTVLVQNNDVTLGGVDFGLDYLYPKEGAITVEAHPAGEEDTWSLDNLMYLDDCTQTNLLPDRIRVSLDDTEWDTVRKIPYHSMIDVRGRYGQMRNESLRGGYLFVTDGSPQIGDRPIGTDPKWACGDGVWLQSVYNGEIVNTVIGPKDDTLWDDGQSAPFAPYFKANVSTSVEFDENWNEVHMPFSDRIYGTGIKFDRQWYTGGHGCVNLKKPNYMLDGGDPLYRFFCNEFSDGCRLENMKDFVLSDGDATFDQPRKVAQYTDASGGSTKTFENYFHTADASYLVPIDQYGQCSMGRDGLMDDDSDNVLLRLDCYGLDQCQSKPACGGEPLYRCLD